MIDGLANRLILQSEISKGVWGWGRRGGQGGEQRRGQEIRQDEMISSDLLSLLFLSKERRRREEREGKGKEEDGVDRLQKQTTSSEVRVSFPLFTTELHTSYSLLAILHLIDQDQALLLLFTPARPLFKPHRLHHLSFPLSPISSIS